MRKCLVSPNITEYRNKKKNLSFAFCELEHLKNMDFIFCKLQNPRKDEFNFIFCKLQNPRNDEFNLVFASLKSLRKEILLTIIFTKGN